MVGTDVGGTDVGGVVGVETGMVVVGGGLVPPPVPTEVVSVPLSTYTPL